MEGNRVQKSKLITLLTRACNRVNFKAKICKQVIPMPKLVPTNMQLHALTRSFNYGLGIFAVVNYAYFRIFRLKTYGNFNHMPS